MKQLSRCSVGGRRSQAYRRCQALLQCAVCSLRRHRTAVEISWLDTATSDRDRWAKCDSDRLSLCDRPHKTPHSLRVPIYSVEARSSWTEDRRSSTLVRSFFAAAVIWSKGGRSKSQNLTKLSREIAITTEKRTFTTLKSDKNVALTNWNKSSKFTAKRSKFNDSCLWLCLSSDLMTKKRKIMKCSSLVYAFATTRITGSSI